LRLPFYPWAHTSFSFFFFLLGWFGEQFLFIYDSVNWINPITNCFESFLLTNYDFFVHMDPIYQEFLNLWPLIAWSISKSPSFASHFICPSPLFFCKRREYSSKRLHRKYTNLALLPSLHSNFIWSINVLHRLHHKSIPTLDIIYYCTDGFTSWDWLPEGSSALGMVDEVSVARKPLWGSTTCLQLILPTPCNKKTMEWHGPTSRHLWIPL
jgi:hypothetical protein